MTGLCTEHLKDHPIKKRNSIDCIGVSKNCVIAIFGYDILFISTDYIDVENIAEISWKFWTT